MRHLYSAPGGLRLIGLPRLAITAAAVWLVPVPLGWLLVQAGPSIGEMTGLATMAFGAALMLSPLFAWAGWVVALPAVALLLHNGWAGWLPMAALGAVAGLVVGKLGGTELAPHFGIASLIALRAALGWGWPAAFRLD